MDKLSHHVQSYPSVALDLLRGWAALTVLLVHVRGASFVEFGSLPPDQKTILVVVLFGLTRIGHEAVLIFFVLSGFLVGGKVIERVRRGTFDLTAYCTDRCTRIGLPLIPACVLTAVINILVFQEKIDIGELLGNMSGFNGIVVKTLDHNAPLWSLSYEIWFYMLGGALGYTLAKKFSVMPMLAFAAAVVVFSILQASYLLYWITGALMVLFADRKLERPLFAVAAICAIVGLIFHELAFSGKSFESTNFVSIETSRALLCIGVAFSFPFLCSPAVNKRLQHIRWPARTLSAMSYTLYLVHYPVNSALDRVFPKSEALSVESIGCFVGRALICLMVATALYFCFERNTRALREYLSSSFRKQTAVLGVN